LVNSAEGPGMRLMGLPIILSETCQTLGTLGDIFLANFRDGYILAEKGGVQSDVSIHVRSTNRWAARSGDVTVKSSLKRGNLSVIDIRQSRASRNSVKAEQGQEFRASVETLHELPLAA